MEGPPTPASTAPTLPGVMNPVALDTPGLTMALPM
jgi:hypothetical protein